MIQKFVDRFMANKEKLADKFSQKHPASYVAIVEAVIETITDEDDYLDIDPSRIHVIDDGDYQGTQLFVIAQKSYQPRKYWCVYVNYGSCSGCDTLASIRTEDEGENPTTSQVSDYLTLALHIVQSLREIPE